MRTTFILAALLAAPLLAPAASAAPLPDAVCPDLGTNQAAACVHVTICCENVEVQATLAAGDAGGARVRTDTVVSLQGALALCASAGETSSGTWLTVDALLAAAGGSDVHVYQGQAGC